ncbi:MAG TPA: hypothetical protein VHD90_01580 [Phototrophicaceae bacterium]|nr:hypothetical protein [Phototrophicaceae bacterium]
MLCLTNGLALLLVALAYTASRNNVDWAQGLFWLSLLAIFIPTALRIVSPSSARKERIALVVLLGCSLYLVKVLQSPLGFTYYDEFLHWQTANNILNSRHLFGANSLLPISPLYPGLETVTTAFANLSGLSVYDSGLITLGIARIGLMLALFLFYERVSDSAEIGGIAALLYTANSNFVFFDSQFSYESLSLPIAMTILYVIASQKQEKHLLTHVALLLPLIALVAVTHHLTGYVLVGFLILWTVAALIRRGEPRWGRLALIALAALLVILGWTVIVGNSIAGYLTPVFRSGINEFLSLLSFDSSGRELFRNAAGQVAPLWERVVGIAAIICILLMLPVGALQIVLSPFRRRLAFRKRTVIPAATLQVWYRYRNSAAALALAGIVLLHPIMQGFRLTSSGWEIANRSSEFLFWAIAFILAVGVVLVRALSIPRRVWLIGFAAWAGIIFVGGAISGWPPWARLPGSYLVSADMRSVEPEGIQAAQWANQYLPPQSRVAADRINTLLMSVYGNQRAITHLADNVYVAPVYFSKTFGQHEIDQLRSAGTQYLLVDTRLATSLPLVGVYFEDGEPLANERLTPLDPEALSKFDAVTAMSRIFDSGDIRLYDVRGLYVTP